MTSSHIPSLTALLSIHEWNGNLILEEIKVTRMQVKMSSK